MCRPKWETRFRKGRRLRVRGLQSQEGSKLNGKVGQCTGLFGGAKGVKGGDGVWTVRIGLDFGEDIGQKAVKVENLEMDNP